MKADLEVVSAAEAGRARETAGLLHHKRILTRRELWILGGLASLPMLSIALRILALPGVESTWLGAPAVVGGWLNQWLSLSDIPAGQRDNVLYLLFVPTYAILVALARLTFGLRVLGFRSILIAVAFHQSGVMASLLLLTLAVVAVVLLRPWLRQVRLPYYARVSVILGVVSVTMVGALLVGPWLRSDIVWGMAAFPVIVLGMLAEGIAHTIDRDNVARASWMAINTVVLAFVMALVGWAPPLRAFLLRFPEFVVTQIVAVVMISEFLDRRLFQHWDEKLKDVFRGTGSQPDSFRVAVIRNRLDPGSRSGWALRSVQKIVDALRDRRYKVKVMEGDASLPKHLKKFFPADAATGERHGVVLNLAQGSRGDAPTTHVPAMLEVFGLAYSGPTPLGHAMTLDRVVAKLIMKQAGIPTPEFRLIATATDDVSGLRFPVAVVPRHQLDAKPDIVATRKQLRMAVRKLLRRGRHDVFVEEYVAGRHIGVALLGNDPIECLPLVELGSDGGEKICPAPVEEGTAARIREHALAAYRACGSRDYARVDIRIGERGDLWVLEVRTLGILAGQGAFVRAGAQAGYSFEDLMVRIVEEARARSRARPERAQNLSAPALLGSPSLAESR